MSLDLVQLRWQQIRATESKQILESENISLKQEINKLKSKKAANDGLSMAKSVINGSCATLRSFSMRLQSEIIQLKFSFIQQLAVLVNDKSSLTQAIEMALSLLKVKETEYKSLQHEMKRRDEQLQEIQKNNNDSMSIHIEETRKLKQKNGELKTQLKEVDAERAHLNNLLNTQKDKILELRNIKDMDDRSREVITSFISG